MRQLGPGVLLLFCLLTVAPPSALAERRVALLIGNQSYSAEIGKLANPHNDVALLEKALKGLKFEVTSVRDAGLAALHQAVNAYARRVKAAGPNAVAFFYYAGHGASDAGANYLIPVDVKSAEEGELWDVSLRLTEITRKLKAEAGNATHFVVFDACRNELKLRKAGTRSLVQSRGFVPVAQESGMLVAYATAEGELASDVGSGAGPYSSVLAEEIVKPGVEAVTMFRNVQRRVRAAIKQEPYLGFNALGDVYLAGLAADLPQTEWLLVRDKVDPKLLNDFAARHSRTVFAELARDRAKKLEVVRSKRHWLFARDRHCVEIKVENGTRCLTPGYGGVDWFADCPNCPDMVIVPDYSHSETKGSDTPFAVGRFVVTRGEFESFVTATGHKTAGGCSTWDGQQWAWQADKSWRKPGFERYTDQHPVVCVGKADAEAYAAWLGPAYRLLTQSERTYVTLGGGLQSPYWWGEEISTARARYGQGGAGSRRFFAPLEQTFVEGPLRVDSFEPNRWGLYNVHGNVWEWVLCDPSQSPDKCIPSASIPIQGGSWTSKAEDLRSGTVQFVPDGARHDIGFRVAKDLKR